MLRVTLEAVLECELGVGAGGFVRDNADIIDTSLAEPAVLVLGENLGTVLALEKELVCRM